MRVPPDVDQGTSTILLALSGLSPAVLTESAWALATESPSSCPSRVVALTTWRGRDAICRDLFESGVWERLRHTLGAAPDVLRFGPAADSLRVFPAAGDQANADDIATPEDSARAGDFILENLRQFTENPDVRIVFSVAGGRKTMTALGALAMTLLGRPGDRLCHVLVTPPFDNPALSPRFAFPDPTIREYALPDGKRIAGSLARITLCDIPYVRTRHLFGEHLSVLPGTFSKLVTEANQRLESSPPLRILLEPRTNTCLVNGRSVALSVSEYLLFWMLCERARQHMDRIIGSERLADLLTEFESTVTPERMPAKLHWRDSSFIEDPDSVRKLVSRLRLKLKAAIGNQPSWPQVNPAPMRGEYGVTLPGASTEIRDPS